MDQAAVTAPAAMVQAAMVPAATAQAAMDLAAIAAAATDPAATVAMVQALLMVLVASTHGKHSSERKCNTL